MAVISHTLQTEFVQAARLPPSAEYLRAALSYDATLGTFRWRERSGMRPSWNSTYAGKISGSITDRGYRVISIDGAKWYAHCLAYCLMTGEWPVGDVDHKNGVLDDNSWDNLRPATRSQNMCNQKLRSDNISGFKGVYKARNRWAAKIVKGHTKLYLGTFDKAEAAHAAYVEAARRLHGEFANDGAS